MHGPFSKVLSSFFIYEGSLCDNDVLGLAVLVDEPRVGLHPLPALVLGQQAEDRQAALPRSHHSDVVLGTVQHVGSMDELVACATHPQLCLGVAQNDLPLGITRQGGEVQLVLCPEDHVLGSDLQDGWGLQGGGDGKKSKLGGECRPIFRPFVLPMKEFQPALKV